MRRPYIIGITGAVLVLIGLVVWLTGGSELWSLAIAAICLWVGLILVVIGHRLLTGKWWSWEGDWT